MEKILVDTEIRRKLENIFGVSRKTVSEALNNRCDSEKCKRIRNMALKLGGAMKQEEKVKVLK